MAVDPIAAAMSAPSSMTTSEGSAVAVPIPSLIAADQYLAAKAAAGNGFSMGGARVAQAQLPPQCDAGLSGSLGDNGGQF